jgi:hypothetical protein
LFIHAEQKFIYIGREMDRKLYSQPFLHLSEKLKNRNENVMMFLEINVPAGNRELQQIF